MPTLAPSTTRARLALLIPKVPVKIDLTWLKGKESAEESDASSGGSLSISQALAADSAKALMIRQVLAINERASAEFLSAFSSDDLRAYRDRLALGDSTGRESRWVRPENTPAVTMWQAR